MNTIPFKITLTFIFFFLFLTVISGQRNNNDGDQISFGTKANNNANCLIYTGQIYRDCMCDEGFPEFCGTVYNPGNYSNKAMISEEQIPTVSYKSDNLTIDTKINAITKIKVQIVDLHTFELKYNLQYTDIGQSGSIIDFIDVTLLDGFYLIILTIDGVISTSKLAVINR